MKRAVLEAAVAARLEKRSVVVLTPLGGGDVRVWSPGEHDLPPDLLVAAVRALATGNASSVETDGGPVFLQPIQPPLRLIIVGAVHIADPLASIALILGYEVTLIDPRTAFARAERWPRGIVVKAVWPEDALAELALDGRTALVALSHDPKIDDRALEAALRSPAFYIGALGSRKSHASRRLRLAESGFREDELGRIHGPIGLAIGARSPGEIAVSIVAQMTDVLRRIAEPRPPFGAQTGASP